MSLNLEAMLFQKMEVLASDENQFNIFVLYLLPVWHKFMKYHLQILNCTVNHYSPSSSEFWPVKLQDYI